jgi:hypothetical protein
MNRCRESRRVQSWLEGDLPGDQATAFAEHLRGCATCEAELRSYRALFLALGDSLAVPDPGPALTERILDRVVPSRLRRRWVNAVGWTYGAASGQHVLRFVDRSASTHGLVQARRASLRSAVLLFVQTLNRLLESSTAGGSHHRGRHVGAGAALARPLAEPTVASILVAAMFACLALLRWMRPQARPIEEEVRHVGLLF